MFGISIWGGLFLFKDGSFGTVLLSLVSMAEEKVKPFFFLFLSCAVLISVNIYCERKSNATATNKMWGGKSQL